MSMEATRERGSPGKILPLQKKFTLPAKTAPKKVILLAGPTACGKTEMSLTLAEALGGEVISADSMQVYRGMDIGTAKVSPDEQAQIPHHLIDIRDVHETFNVVDFYYEARQCLDAILARDRVPIVVGGSGFYFRALLYGPPSGPPSLPEMRQNIEKEFDRLGPEAMYAKLQEMDPEYAKTITPRDRQKVVRALEIITLSGGKVSDLKWETHHLIPDYAFHPWFVHRPRASLYERINARCEQMLERGLIEEVKALEKLGLRGNPSASQAIGYRQVLDYLETDQTPEDYAKFVRQFKLASRHYAKRQFTWFRKEPIFEWLDVDLHDFEICIDRIIQDYYHTT